MGDSANMTKKTAGKVNVPSGIFMSSLLGRARAISQENHRRWPFFISRAKASPFDLFGY